MKLRSIWSVLLVFLSLSGYPLIAQTLNGTVRDATGAVLYQAVVVVQHWGNDAQHRVKPDPPMSVQPDFQGHYSISLLPGIYDVLVSCPFCMPQLKQVKVKAGGDVQFSPQLKFSRLMKMVE